jgi:uncharacterized protein (TIGR03545 family)
MRKQGLVFLIVLAVIVIVINSVVTDRWIERRLERFASRLNGARVEFDRVAFSPFGLSLSWEGLQVTDQEDTWHNLFETGHCSFDLSLEPLLKRAFLIEDFDVEGLRFGTQRKTDGGLPREKKTKSLGESAVVQSVQRNIQAELERYPLLNLGILQGSVRVEAVWDAAALETPDRLISLRNRVEQRYDEWASRLESLPDEVDIESLRREVDSIRVDQIDTPQEVQSSYELLQSVRERTEEYQTILRQAAEDFNRQRADLAGLGNDIGGWVQEDYERLLDLAGMPELSRESIARMLFGERFSRRMEKALQVLGKVRTYSRKVGSYVPAKKLPPRGMGQDIQFVREREYPGFWVKRLRLTGETPAGLGFGGSLLDVVSNQNKIDRPTTLLLAGERPDGAGLDFSGVIDGRGRVPHEQFNLRLRGLSLQGHTLTDFPLLPYTVSSGTATLEGSVDFEGEDFLSEIHFSGRGIGFETAVRPEGMSDEIHRMSLYLARRIDEVDLTAVVRQSGNEFRMDIRSNLDDIVLETLKEAVSEELRQVQEELMERIEAEIGASRDEILALVDERESSLGSILAEREGLLTAQLDRIDRKRREIDNLLKDEQNKLRKKVETELQRQKDMTADEAKDLIDSMFKK